MTFKTERQINFLKYHIVSRLVVGRLSMTTSLFSVVSFFGWVDRIWGQLRIHNQI